MNIFGCNHKYGKEDNGYQYCEKCGKGIAMPKKVCSHKFNIIDTFKWENSFYGSSGRIYMLQCEKCGEMKKERTDK